MAQRKADCYFWGGDLRTHLVSGQMKLPLKQTAHGIWAPTRTSNGKLVGLRQHHLQDGHERRRLAEVAVADDVGVDVEALRVGSGLDGPRYVMKPSNDGRRELSGGKTTVRPTVNISLLF